MAGKGESGENCATGGDFMEERPVWQAVQLFFNVVDPEFKLKIGSRGEWFPRLPIFQAD